MQPGARRKRERRRGVVHAHIWGMKEKVEGGEPSGKGKYCKENCWGGRGGLREESTVVDAEKISGGKRS